MTSTHTFDIVYVPVALCPPVYVHVIQRRVAAIDRNTALLRWMRDELGLKIDPLDLPDAVVEKRAKCKCEFFVTFRVENKLTGVRSFRYRRREGGLRAGIECDPCSTHARTGNQDHPRNHRDWGGEFTAYAHDPKRKDTYEAR